MELFGFVYSAIVTLLCILLSFMLVKKSKIVKVVSIESLENRINKLEEKLKQIKCETSSIKI